jgi:hypothetical protein
VFDVSIVADCAFVSNAAVSTVVESCDAEFVDCSIDSAGSAAVGVLFPAALAAGFAADPLAFGADALDAVDFAVVAFAADVLFDAVCFAAAVFAAPVRVEPAFVVDALPAAAREEEPLVEDFVPVDFVVLVFAAPAFCVELLAELLEVAERRLACARRMDSAGSDDVAGAASAEACSCATSSARSPRGKKTSDGRPVSWLGISEPRPRPRPRRFSAIPDSSQ